MQEEIEDCKMRKDLIKSVVENQTSTAKDSSLNNAEIEKDLDQVANTP